MIGVLGRLTLIGVLGRAGFAVEASRWLECVCSETFWVDLKYLRSARAAVCQTGLMEEVCQGRLGSENALHGDYWRYTSDLS